MTILIFLIFLFLSRTSHAATPPAGAVLRVVATASYVPEGITQTEVIYSNVVIAVVMDVEAVILTESQAVSRPPGSLLELSHLIANTGNVASTYSINLKNDGQGCGPSTTALTSLRLLRDFNNNGVADPADIPVALGVPGGLKLLPGESAALLIQGNLPFVANGQACVALSASTALQGVNVANQDTVNVGNGAVLLLSKSANYKGIIVPGKSQIDFNISATNIGGQNAQPDSSLASVASTLFVNGAVSRYVLLSDVVPAGTRYVPGSLRTTAADAVRLYRRPGDPAFNFQTMEDPDAIEVGIGISTAVTPNATIAMQFSVAVDAAQAGDIRNVAQGYYNDGITSAVSPSNMLVISAGTGYSRLGVAKSASNALPNRTADGAPDGTATVRFTLKVRNYGSAWLYGVQTTDLLEGSGASQFGTYSNAAVPASGRYTVVAGSIAVISGATSFAAGTIADVNKLFTGESQAQNLLAPGAVLPPGAEISLKFDVRVNLTGRVGGLSNTARGAASLAEGADPTIFDDSIDGTDPDPDNDGNPNNNSSVTSVSTELPALVLVKTASLPRALGNGAYELDYTFKVTNNGGGPASYVRLIENLNCAFDMDKPNGSIASWELVGRPVARNGYLRVAPGFTGGATCDRTLSDSANPFDLPPQLILNLTDGTRALEAHQTEEIIFTVRANLKPDLANKRAAVLNKGWAAAFTENVINFTSSAITAASSSTVTSLLIDPQGVIYNAATRQPVAGAVVTFTRQSCGAGYSSPIAAAEIFGGSSGAYTFNTDGSLSMTTAADGAYQFFFRSPPVTGLCTYGIAAAPPAGSAYVAPSELLPVTAGVFGSCGAVVPRAGAPQGGDPTTYYGSVVSGQGLGDRVCEVTHNNIPLDPGNIQGLILRKEGSKRQAELGDFIDYTLTVTNKTGMSITGLDIRNTLPIGFAYVRGSTQIDGVSVANPVGAVGPELTFHFPDLVLGPDGSSKVRFRVRIGVGAPTNGDATSHARAYAGPLQSNPASWTVRISGGVFSDEAFVFGKIYMDCTRDGEQKGTDEVGVPGVRLYMENGTFAITDVEGKWSLYGLKPITHVLRVDETTLPTGARLEILDNRNAGNPASRFVDLVKGEFHKADFIITNCEDKHVAADVAARRSAAATNPNAEGEAQIRTRLDPEGKPFVVGDTRGLPASGQSSGTGSIGQLPSTTAPLIQLPSQSSKGAGSFVGASGAATGGTLGMINGIQPAAAGSLFSSLSGLPASAQPSSVTSAPATGPGALNTRSLATSGAMLEPRAQPMVENPAPSQIELETLLPSIEDNALGFIDPSDGDTMPTRSVNVRVKGEDGSDLRLTVNGEVIDAKRVGRKVSLASKKLIAWEYIGVSLHAGSNELSLEATDPFGNLRGAARSIRIVAPDKLGSIEINVPPSARADSKTGVPVRIRLIDAAGVPVTARTQLTLESDRGHWPVEDLNTKEPGVQVFIKGGSAQFEWIPPGEPGTAQIRVSAGPFSKQVSIALLPELRPMIGVGVIEGVLDLTNRGKLPMGAMPAGAAFETELRSLGGDSPGSRGAGRSAFFFKGAVKGEYLLTASFDSDKTEKDRVFRDIRPDEFYPVYGDSSTKGFDAQSTQKLYVRIDKNRSYILYGDFSTASSSEVRSLSQTNRTLTGLKQVYEDQNLRITSYASKTSQTQQIEEFRALGISGPYVLAVNSGDFVANTETVEIVVRDQNQPDIVLQRTPVTRFVDYTIDSISGGLLFTHPISSVDANLNPQSIRITYEVDNGGNTYVVAGTDAQVKVTDKLQIGAVVNTDRNPANRRDLAAVTALARVGDNTTVAAELVKTQSDANGAGTGGRVEVRHQDENLAVVGLANKTTAGFDNPGASVSAGRTDVSARAEYRIDPSLAVRGEAFYSDSATQELDRQGVTVSVQKKISDTATVEAGVRHGQSNSSLGSASGFDYGTTSTYSGGLGSNLGAGNTTALGAAASSSADDDSLTTVRARISTQVPGLQGAQAFVEGEQSLADSDRQTLGIGANYALTDKTRAYGRYELISNLYGPYELGGTQVRNVGILGIESAYMEGGRVYNEYRLADSLDGRGVVAALGVRNTFQISPNVRITGGVEHTRNLSSASNSVNNGTGYSSTLGESTAITAGAEYSTERLKASGIVEAREGSDSTTRLFSGGIGYKLTPEVSVLARSVISDSDGQGASAGNGRQLQRHQIGLAYRPVDTNTWNALARYEHKSDKVAGVGNSTGGVIDSSASIAAGVGSTALAGKYTTDIVSAHLNVNPQRGTYVTSRYAVKVSKADDGVLSSSYWAHMLQGRVTRDISKDWDIGLQAGVLYGEGGAMQKSLGMEVGYQVYREIWVSGGYNIVGLTDRDLTVNEYTSKGAYVRLRMKFDETALGFPSAAAAGRPAVAPVAQVPESRTRQADAPALEMSTELGAQPAAR